MDVRRTCEKLDGRVELRPVNQGTASAHEGVVLVRPSGEVVLIQRIGGNPFRDGPTDALVGHRVVLEGFRLGSLFRFTRVCSVEGTPPAGGAEGEAS